MNQAKIDFEQAMGEAFSDYVSPPVPFDDASPHECCEVLWQILGNGITPTTLSLLSDRQLDEICVEFGEYFECEPPELIKIKAAVEATLSRWPPGTLEEDA